MHFLDRICNGLAMSNAKIKVPYLQLLLVAFAFLHSLNIHAQCPPDHIILADLNFSLNARTCDGELTVAEVQGNNEIDGCDCEVTVLDEHDNEMPAMFDFDDVGQTFRYQLCCGVVCGWANVTVEYKGNAQFLCPDDGVVMESSCIELNEVIPPIAESQCVDPGVILISEVQNLVDCADGVQRQLTRTFQITGPQGPIQQFCTQTINIVAADLSDITMPDKVSINCDQEPTLDLTGAPIFTTTIDGEEVEFELTPDSLPLDCSVFVSFEDTEFGETVCGRIITRMWSVGQWTCDLDTVITFPQIINVTDINPPVIICPRAITATTNTDDCTAVINLPPAQASDDCTDDDDLIFSVATPFGTLNTNGGFGTLDTGSYQITYFVSDCMNTSMCMVDIEIQDLTPPVAICETDIVIGYAGDGNTFLDAYKIDAGSFDDCGKVKFGIARMVEGLDIPDHTFEDRIEIFCEDIEMPFLAILQLTDSEGNVSFCMVEVTVTNKLIPTLMCPEPDTVACDSIFDENNLSVFFNAPTLGGSICLGGFTLQDVLLGDRNDCGVGELRRRIRLFDPDGMRVGQCFTTVVFEAPMPFMIDDMGVFPEDICDPVNVCTVEEIPDFDFDFDIEQERCQLLGISTEIIETTANPLVCPNGPNTVDICQQFIRRFTVIDWCTIDGPGSKSDPFIFEQIININETEAPEVANPDDLMFCVPLDDCDELFVQIPAPTILDNNCGGGVTIEYEVFNNTDPNAPSENMEGDMISGNFAVGSYTILWRYTDACGNITPIRQDFIVQNCKAPAITCVAGLAIPILPVDLDGDDKPDTNQASLETKQVIVYAANSCDDATGIIVSFDSSALVETITFDCDDIGEEPLSVNVFATNSDGFQSSCTTTIALSDNGLCPEMPDNIINNADNEARVSVSGNVLTPSNININGADVALVGSSAIISTSTENGNYAFDDMPTGASYVVKPSVEGDVLEGISIVDMILIQQHILNINTITNPYLLLAADVNGSGDVSIADVILLQRISLGLSELPVGVPNWRIVDADAEFFDPSNPFTSNLSDQKEIENLQEDEVLNFVGIKTGDINGNVLSSTENRSDVSAFLKVADLPHSNDNAIVPFYISEKLSSINGISIELNTSDLNLLDFNSPQLEAGTYTMNTSNGQLQFVSVSEDELSIDPDAPLFELVLDENSYSLSRDLLQDAKVVVARELNGDITEQKLEVKFDSDFYESDFVNIIPNPWNDKTRVEISANEKCIGSFVMTDLGGNTIHQTNVQFDKGSNTIELSSELIHIPGVYFIHVSTPTSRQTVKMIKLE